MTNDISQFTKLLSESTTGQKKLLLAELARDLNSTAQPGVPVPIQDPAGTLLGYLLPRTAEEEPFPTDENSPEFYQALLRRLEEPTLTVDECLAMLRSEV